MTLQTRLESDMKDAMRSRDVLRRSTIRLLRSEIRNEEIAKRVELDDSGVIGVLNRQAQQRRDSIEAFTDGNRQDLADKEKAELAIILEYLPEPMTAEEVTVLVQDAISKVAATGPGDMGKVMGQVMPQVKGRADGKVVSAIVTEALQSRTS